MLNNASAKKTFLKVSKLQLHVDAESNNFRKCSKPKYEFKNIRLLNSYRVLSKYIETNLNPLGFLSKYSVSYI